MKSFLPLENTKKIANKKQNNGAGPNLLLFKLIKLQLLPIFLVFFSFFLQFLKRNKKCTVVFFPLFKYLKKIANFSRVIIFFSTENLSDLKKKCKLFSYAEL